MMIKLKSESIELNGQKFTVKELTPRVVLPLLASEPDQLAIEIAKLSVHIDSKPVGDDLLDMGFGTFNKLLTAVTEINGLGESGNA